MEVATVCNELQADEPTMAMTMNHRKRRIERRVERRRTGTEQLNPKTRREAKRESNCTAQYQPILSTIQLIAY